MNETQTKVTLRHMQQQDMDALLACEARHAIVDPDFEVPQLESHAWSEQEVRRAVRQYKSRARGTLDTRLWVADVPYEDGVWTCGAMAYEINPAGYTIVFFTAHQKAPPEVRPTLLDLVLTRARRSQTRKKIVVLVADGDWENLKFFQDCRFKVTLVSHPTDSDTWRCEYDINKEEENTVV